MTTVVKINWKNPTDKKDGVQHTQTVDESQKPRRRRGGNSGESRDRDERRDKEITGRFGRGTKSTRGITPVRRDAGTQNNSLKPFLSDHRRKMRTSV